MGLRFPEQVTIVRDINEVNFDSAPEGAYVYCSRDSSLYEKTKSGWKKLTPMDPDAPRKKVKELLKQAKKNGFKLPK